MEKKTGNMGNFAKHNRRVSNRGEEIGVIYDIINIR